ncbi:hypothetical protein CNMCM5793_000963 [Aspergillus hiratsukae]|uniref:Uncharacterized protein n=1 Tax=Aspergillus hiratsukae TaxID=1194566 RepID=A0A8H6PB28_9EURO|nr:hypothetical protein CNMCM5793_000963 [Aspergillus hiratsukae]KAF7163549.1 hypothetical protein CNMCM6106_000453 [Aspergillus hiratsukae]
MEAFGPSNTKDAGHMKDLAIFVVAFTLIAELLAKEPAVSRLRLLGDPNRLNVDLSRAQAGMYIITGWKQLSTPD